MKEGEIQVIADNNAAAGVDMGASSTLWKAINKDGQLVAPGSANTLKLDYTADPGTSGTKGVCKLVTTLTYQQTVEEVYSQGEFENMTADSSITVPEVMKALCLYPSGDKENCGDYIYMKNIGERLPFRGGSFDSTSNAGVFALNCNIPTHAFVRPYWVSLCFRRYSVICCLCSVMTRECHLIQSCVSMTGNFLEILYIFKALYDRISVRK